MDERTDFLGRGWRFPPDVDPRQGTAAMIEGEPDVEEAVRIILETAKGERVMLPTYGCELNRLMFQPNDDTTAGLAIHYVRKALLRWEPRVEILKLDAGRSAEDPGRLDIALHYRVRPTSSEQQLVVGLQLMHPEI